MVEARKTGDMYGYCMRCGQNYFTCPHLSTRGYCDDTTEVLRVQASYALAKLTGHLEDTGSFADPTKWEQEMPVAPTNERHCGKELVPR